MVQPVSVINYWDLGFVWNLVLGIWNLFTFIYRKILKSSFAIRHSPGLPDPQEQSQVGPHCGGISKDSESVDAEPDFFRTDGPADFNRCVHDLILL